MRRYTEAFPVELKAFITNGHGAALQVSQQTDAYTGKGMAISIPPALFPKMRELMDAIEHALEHPATIACRVCGKDTPHPHFTDHKGNVVKES